MRILAAGLAAVLAASNAAGAAATDGASPEAAVAALYACVTHPPDRAPDFARMRALVLPGGLFVPPRREGEDLRVLDVDGFAAGYEKAVAARRAKGEAPAGFYEREVARHADCYGAICNVFSTYESRRAAADARPFQRGINAIQLVRGRDGWRIASVVWDAESPDNPIPADRLPR
jgi:hypothetical protein